MATARARKETASYLNLEKPGTGAAEYAFLSVGFTELNESPNAQSKTVRYIHESASTTTITGYEPEYSFSAEQIKSEEVLEYITEIAKFRKVGEDTQRELVNVELDQPVNGEDNTYYARKELVAIEVSSFGDDDGTQSIEGTFKAIGDVVQGTFDTTTKTWAVLPAGQSGDIGIE